MRWTRPAKCQRRQKLISIIPGADATAEINLDDLGLDISDLDETSVASDIVDDDLISDLDDTAESQSLKIDDSLAETGTNEAVGLDDSLESTGRNPALADDDATQLAAIGDFDEDTDVGIDTSLLDATGQTQILTEDMAVETGRHAAADLSGDDATMLADFDDDDTIDVIPDEAATMLAPLDDEDDGEFDFAKTEALPKDVFSSDMSTDETGKMTRSCGQH